VRQAVHDVRLKAIFVDSLKETCAATRRDHHGDASKEQAASKSHDLQAPCDQNTSTPDESEPDETEAEMFSEFGDLLEAFDAINDVHAADASISGINVEVRKCAEVLVSLRDICLSEIQTLQNIDTQLVSASNVANDLLARLQADIARMKKAMVATGFAPAAEDCELAVAPTIQRDRLTLDPPAHCPIALGLLSRLETKLHDFTRTREERRGPAGARTGKRLTSRNPREKAVLRQRKRAWEVGSASGHSLDCSAEPAGHDGLVVGEYNDIRYVGGVNDVAQAQQLYKGAPGVASDAGTSGSVDLWYTGTGGSVDLCDTGTGGSVDPCDVPTMVEVDCSVSPPMITVDTDSPTNESRASLFNSPTKPAHTPSRRAQLLAPARYGPRGAAALGGSDCSVSPSVSRCSSLRRSPCGSPGRRPSIISTPDPKAKLPTLEAASDRLRRLHRSSVEEVDHSYHHLALVKQGEDVQIHPAQGFYHKGGFWSRRGSESDLRRLPVGFGREAGHFVNGCEALALLTQHTRLHLAPVQVSSPSKTASIVGVVEKEAGVGPKW